MFVHHINAKRIPVACAFHSPLVELAQKRLAALLETIEFRRKLASIPTHWGPYPDDPAEICRVLSLQLRSPCALRRRSRRSTRRQRACSLRPDRAAY